MRTQDAEKVSSMNELMTHLLPPDECAFTLSLSNHRGRIFTKEFFVAGDDRVGGLFVWGYSASGARQVVSRPKKGPKRYGKRDGWTFEKARAVAVLLNAALVAVLHSTSSSTPPSGLMVFEGELLQGLDAHAAPDEKRPRAGAV